jgi:SAM-dependent methyltransferase
MDLPHSPAAERNSEPILQALRTILPERGTALEIASGTGQHAEFFAAALPAWTWQPTEADTRLLNAIAARIARAGLANVRAPVALDVLAPEWPIGERFDAIYCANMLHISPWPTCAALMHGAARHLAPGGVLLTYGPYFEDDVPAAPSNEAFDASLRARDPSWGIRRLQDVEAQARHAGLVLRARHAMPANNLLLEFVVAADAASGRQP